MIKNYVIDTNLIMDNPNVIFGFDDNNVYITGTTIQELDRHKRDKGEVGYNVREFTKILKELAKQGNLLKGVKMKNKGTIYTIADGVDAKYLPKGFSLTVDDNCIIAQCKFIAETTKLPTILLTNDGLMYISAVTCGVEVQDVLNDKIEDTNYTGHIELVLKTNDCINAIYKDGKVKAGDVLKQSNNKKAELFENEFVTLRCGQSSALSVHQNGVLKLISEKHLPRVFGGISPRNKMQTYALWALLNPEIDLVILKGVAGTAKTFLSIAAGLTQSFTGQKTPDDIYNEILIARPNVEGSDPGFGFLPGELEEKMAPLLASYYDNLENLFEANYGKKDLSKKDVRKMIDDMFESGTLSVCPLNTIRGRSLKYKYMICDEAQNSNKQLIKAVITRAGEGTKIIVAGDPDQCDALRLNKDNNGLVYASEAMKGAPRTAIIQFDEAQCERSALAKIAVERMR